MGQLCLEFAPASAESDGARYNPLAEVRLRTPNEIRDVRNIVQMNVDPDGKGLPDHWSREGSAFLTGMILDQLYAGRDKTLSGLEERLCDPGQPIDDTMQQIMRAEHDPSGSLGWTDSRGIATRHIRSSRVRCAACSTRARTNAGRDLRGEGIPRALSRSGHCHEHGRLRLSNHGFDES